MQIQDDRRRIDSPQEPRFKSEDNRAVGKGRVFASSSVGVFAEIFAAIESPMPVASVPSPVANDSLDETQEQPVVDEAEVVDEEENLADSSLLDVVPLTPQVAVQDSSPEAELPEADASAEIIQSLALEQKTESPDDYPNEKSQAIVETDSETNQNLKVPTTAPELVASTPVVEEPQRVQPAATPELGQTEGKRSKTPVEKPATSVVQEPELTGSSESKEVTPEVNVRGEQVVQPASGDSGSASSKDRQGRRGRQTNGDSREKIVEANNGSGSSTNSSTTGQNSASSTVGKVATPENGSLIENPSSGLTNAAATAPTPSVSSASSIGAAVASATSQATSPTRGAKTTAAGPGAAIVGSQPTAGTTSAPDAAVPDTGANRRAELADRARLVHRIAKAFQRLSVEGGQVRLKMHPEELGGVQLDMQITGRRVSATVVAESEAASQLLKESLPELRQRLESQGLVVEKLEVEHRTGADGTGPGSQKDRHFGSGSDPREGVWRRPREPQPMKPIAVTSRVPSQPAYAVGNSGGLDLKI